MEFPLTVIEKRYFIYERQRIPVARHKLMFPHISIDGRTYDVEVEGVPVYLTTTEFEILYLLACLPRETLSANQIYRCVWQMEDLGNISPVRVHIANLRRKLLAYCPEHEFITCKWKKGYQFVTHQKKENYASVEEGRKRHMPFCDL